MPVCCIGGVCIPYSAIFPFLLLGLQWVFGKLVALGLVPQWIQDKIHNIMEQQRPSSTLSSNAQKQKLDGSQRKRQKSNVKAESLSPCCSTMTAETVSLSSCCGDNSTGETSVTCTSAKKDAAAIQTIQSQDEWDEFSNINSGKNQNSNNKLVVVKMTATWCQPCKQIHPVFEVLAAQNVDYCACAVVDVDELDGVAAQFRVAALPTFLAIQPNTQVVVHRYSGSNEAQLANFFEKILTIIKEEHSSSS